MLFLIRTVAVRHLLAAPGRSLLTLLGISLGVAAILATRIIDRSVMASFRDAISELSGNASLSIGTGTGVDESILEDIRAVAGVSAASPVIEETVHDVQTQSQLLVLALDTLRDEGGLSGDGAPPAALVRDELAFLNDPLGVVITNRYASRHGLRVGDAMLVDSAVGRVTMHVHGTVEAVGPAKLFDGNILFMDVFAAQLTFQRGTRFDRIDVISDEGGDISELQRELERAVAGSAEVAPPSRRSKEAEHILAGFGTALSLASLSAVFVGCFIVYNALAIAVARRRREVGVLRALGASRRGILALFLGEGAVLGTAGGAFGLLLGLVLARTSLATVGATISTLYMHVEPQALTLAKNDFLLAIGAGLLSALLAAYVPAQRGASLSPVLAMQKQARRADVTVSSRYALKGMVASLVAVVSIAGYVHVREDVVFGYAVTVLLAAVLVLGSPYLSRMVASLARSRLATVGPAVELGLLAFQRNTGRNAVAIAALAMALASIVNVDALLDSMKHSTEGWLNRSFRADLFVFAGDEVQARFAQTLPAQLGDALRQRGDVQFVQAFRMKRQSYRGRPFHMMSEDFEGYRRLNDFAVVEGDFNEALPYLLRGSAVAVSQQFARTFQVRLGDTLSLQTAEGVHEFTAALIYVDYRSDLGCVMAHRDIFTRLWNDTTVDLYGIYLKEGADASLVRREIERTWGRSFRLRALANREYLGELVSLIERALAMSRASELVALAVAVLGVINTLLVSVIDRRSEFGVLKALGASREQVQRVVLTEAALLGLTASIAGLLLGLVLSAYAIFELLPLQVGWRMHWHPSALMLLYAFLLAELVTLLAAWWPMQSAGRLEVAEAIQAE